ncbi:superfamily II DNA/RNA helicase [Streptomyces griseochromogenes]|nr:superfamily II DNA/RNA helicase [Streptomyces griseochromogenes]
MPERLLAALRTEGVTVPFPIQAATLPNALASPAPSSPSSCRTSPARCTA